MADEMRERIARVLIDDHIANGFTAGFVETEECKRLANLIAAELQSSGGSHTIDDDHGIQLILTHGQDCPGCIEVRDITFDAIARNRHDQVEAARAGIDAFDRAPADEPHRFEGVVAGVADRGCTRCGKPDRHPIHKVPT